MEDDEILYWMQKEALCERYKWKPKTVDNMDCETISKFSAIASGRLKRESKEMK